MRVPFSQIFSVNSNGSITPKVRVKVGGVTMGPGVAFGKGVAFSGVDLASHAGKDLDVKYEGDVLVLKGIYT